LPAKLVPSPGDHFHVAAVVRLGNQDQQVNHTFAPASNRWDDVSAPFFFNIASHPSCRRLPRLNQGSTKLNLAISR